MHTSALVRCTAARMFEVSVVQTVFHFFKTRLYFLKQGSIRHCCYILNNYKQLKLAVHCVMEQEVVVQLVSVSVLCSTVRLSVGL